MEQGQEQAAVWLGARPAAASRLHSGCAGAGAKAGHTLIAHLAGRCWRAWRGLADGWRGVGQQLQHVCARLKAFGCGRGVRGGFCRVDCRLHGVSTRLLEAESRGRPRATQAAQAPHGAALAGSKAQWEPKRAMDRCENRTMGRSLRLRWRTRIGPPGAPSPPRPGPAAGPALQSASSAPMRPVRRQPPCAASCRPSSSCRCRRRRPRPPPAP